MSSNPNSNGFKTGVIDFTAGSIGAIAGSMVGFPLDTIKMKMQIYPHLYRSPFDCFRKTFRKEGIPGFYRGINLGLWSDIAEKSTLFLSYGYCQRWVCRYRGHEKPSILDDAYAGFIAAFFSTLAMSPMDLIKCRLQTLTERRIRPGMTAFQMVIKILEEEGFRGLYRGFNSTLVREMVGYFFYFGGYGFAKYCLKSKEEEKLGTFKLIMAGGFGGVCLWISVFPIDMVKSIVQVDNQNEYMIIIIRKIVKKHGFRGLYKGLTPTLIRSFVSAAALFVAYENSKEIMTKFFVNNPKK